MLVTVTNTSGLVLNALDVHDGGSGAVGGARKRPLPYPFDLIGSLAISGTKQLAMHPSDWRYKRVPWVPHEPKDLWNGLVHRGYVTMAFAVQEAGSGNLQDQESRAVDTI